MGLVFKFFFDPAAWEQAIRDKQRPVATAAVAALQETAANAVRDGRQNIAGSGRFGSKWTQSLKFSMQGDQVGGEPSLQAKAIVFDSMRIAGVFEFGATIQGKPLLWIPTTLGGPPARRSGKRLVSATIHGQPVLFDASDHDRHKKPLYIGVPSVTIPKTWRITEIVKQHAAQIAVLFVKYFKDE